MKNRRNKFLYIILIITVLSGCQNKKAAKLEKDESYHKNYEAGPINLELTLNKKEISLAETLHLILNVKIKKEYEVDFPEFQEKLNEFQMRDFKYNSPKLADKDQINTSMEYFLEPYLSGEYKIPPLTVYFWTTEEGKEHKHQIETEEVTVKVTSLLKEDYKNLVIKDIQGPLTPPSKFWLIFTILIIAVLLIAAAGLFMFFYLKKRQKETQINYISAYQLALDRLDALVKEQFIEKNEIKAFYYTISTIFRKYIEDRFHVKAPEQTTEEFLENFKKNRSLFQEKEKTLFQDEGAQVADVHSVSAGLDYPGVGPEHSLLKEKGRALYGVCYDWEALDAFGLLARTEGILPALESAHALGFLVREKERFAGTTIIINLSGRGDKDMEIVRSGGGVHG